MKLYKMEDVADGRNIMAYIFYKHGVWHLAVSELSLGNPVMEFIRYVSLKGAKIGFGKLYPGYERNWREADQDEFYADLKERFLA